MSNCDGEKRTATENGGQAVTDRVIGGAMRKYGLYLLLPLLGTLPGWGPAVFGKAGATAEAQVTAAAEARTARRTAGKVADAQVATDRVVAEHTAAIEYIKKTVDDIKKRLDTIDRRLDTALKQEH